MVVDEVGGSDDVYCSNGGTVDVKGCTCRTCCFLSCGDYLAVSLHYYAAFGIECCWNLFLFNTLTAHGELVALDAN